jgi:hypothetical protein
MGAPVPFRVSARQLSEADGLGCHKEKYMRATRKLFLVGALALAALAMMASSASAVTILQEPGNTPCEAGPVLDTHVVDGGCHADFGDADGIPLYVHTGAAEVVLQVCTWSFEARLDRAGNGYVTNQVFSNPPPPAPPDSCTRTPCDEANMAKLAWPLNITATNSLETVFCMRTIPAGEGQGRTLCHIVLPISGSAHTYTVGGSLAEYQCEGLPVEFSDIELVAGAERIEIRP